MSSHGLVQIMSRPTNIIHSSATLIDRVYTSNIDTVISCNILALDLSDHLVVHTNVTLDINSNILYTYQGVRRGVHP